MISRPNPRRLVAIVPWVLLALVGGVYASTMAPAITQTDAGELATVQATAGIAHPPGYGLFAVLGFLFSKIPIGTVVARLTVMNLLCCVVGVELMRRSLVLVLEHIGEADHSSRGGAGEPGLPRPTLIRLASITGALVLAFCQTYWQQSTGVEVYALQAVLLLAAQYWFFAAYFRQPDEVGPWLIGAALWAFAFAHHLTSVFVLPGVAYLFFSKLRLGPNVLRRLGAMLAVAVACVALCWAWIWIRAATHPMMNWGQIGTFSRLINHVTAGRYHGRFFYGPHSGKNLYEFLRSLPDQLGVLALLLAAVGVWVGLSRHRRIVNYLFVTAAATVLWSVNYAIHDLESYFVTAYMCAAMLAGLGLYFVGHAMGRARYGQLGIEALVALTLAVVVATNYRRVDSSDLTLYDDYTRAVLATASPNGLIIATSWRALLSPADYVQNVEGFAPDVTLVGYGTLGEMWSYRALERRHPGVVGDAAAAVLHFRSDAATLARWDGGGGYLNEAGIVRLMQTAINNLIAANIDQRPVYLTHELMRQKLGDSSYLLPPGLTLVPENLLFRVLRRGDYAPAPAWPLGGLRDIRFPHRLDRYSYPLLIELGMMLLERADYEESFAETDRAAALRAQVRDDFPAAWGVRDLFVPYWRTPAAADRE